MMSGYEFNTRLQEILSTTVRCRQNRYLENGWGNCHKEIYARVWDRLAFDNAEIEIQMSAETFIYVLSDAIKSEEDRYAHIMELCKQEYGT